MFYVRHGFSGADNAGGTLTRDRWWPQAVAPTERGARWNFPVVRNTGHHFSRLPNFSLVRDHTPAPYQSKQGWRRGWRGFFLLPTIPNIANKTSAPWIHQKELIVEDTGQGYHEGSCWNFGIYHHQCAGEISRSRYLQINI